MLVAFLNGRVDNVTFIMQSHQNPFHISQEEITSFIEMIEATDLNLAQKNYLRYTWLAQSVRMEKRGR